MIVGIDPDLVKSGIATMDGLKNIEYSTLNFVDVCAFIKGYKDIIKCVYLEAGWLNKSIHHFAENKSVAGRIGVKVGMNHATGMLLQQVIEAEGVKVILCRPTKSKLNAEQFKKLTKIETRTNQEQRDAIMLVWGRQ